ncbi:MAG: hypothetical protein FWE86_04910 [Oscillospiraceae bacterium]|nr:hypothetical protein [Oscillospiraceae bacterium]
MAMKLFNDDVAPSCAYCVVAEKREDGRLFCPKRGPVNEHGHCGWYEYDPLRRVPKQAPRLPEFSAEDFPV